MQMTSEEERVEVAESIRHYAKESDESAYEFIRGYWPNDLADLIDPTCRQVIAECNDGLMPPFTAHCSKCGAQWGYTPNYCPNCGARVVNSGSQ